MSKRLFSQYPWRNGSCFLKKVATLVKAEVRYLSMMKSRLTNQ